MKRNQDCTDPPEELLRPLTRSRFLVRLLGRLSFLSLSLSSLEPAFLHCRVHSFLSLLPLRTSLSRKSAVLTHLNSLSNHDLVIWTDSTHVFANCFFVTLKPLFFLAGPVRISFSAKGCTILPVPAAPTSLPLLFSSPTIALSLPLYPLLGLFFYHKLSGRDCLLSPPSRSSYNGSLDTRFSRGTTRLMSWPDGERYSRPLQSPVASLLLSLVSTFIFSQSGGVLSHLLFNTQVPSISTEKPVLPRHTCCALSYLFCNGHSLLLISYLTRIGRIENPLCSACGHPSQGTSHLILHCPATVSRRPLVQAPRSCPLSGTPWSSATPPSFRRGRVKTTTTQQSSVAIGKASSFINW